LKKANILIWISLVLFLLNACQAETQTVEVNSPQAAKLIQGALQQIGKTLIYDPAYVRLDYPGGDIPLVRGVCTDVVVRAFRHTGIDLQVKVHEDMRKAFKRYPQNWGLKRPDKNIDHRRVPNLRTYFKRQGKSLPVTQNASHYQPGDVVTWRLDNNLVHIGIVSNQKRNGRFLIIHNIGAGTVLEDVLFEFDITGHYRFFGD